MKKSEELANSIYEIAVTLTQKNNYKNTLITFAIAASYLIKYVVNRTGDKYIVDLCNTIIVEIEQVKCSIRDIK